MKLKSGCGLSKEPHWEMICFSSHHESDRESGLLTVQSYVIIEENHNSTDSNSALYRHYR